LSFLSFHIHPEHTEAPCKINKVLSHPTLPITITAQEDRHIQFFDNNTGEMDSGQFEPTFQLE
jgi:striatin 1/3/4